MHRVVLDTNVLIAALFSRRGASFRLMQLVGSGQFEICVSVPLVLEYEAVAKRWEPPKIALSEQDIDDIIDYLCSVAYHHAVYYLWRPLLKDAHDDMVLELAVSGDCSFIVTHNVSDFEGAERFGIEVVTPKEFLEKIGALP